MSLTLFWTNTAKETYQYVLDYLLENWNQKQLEKFITRTEKVLKLISKNPEIFECIIENKSIHKGIIHKHCSFLYKIADNKIHILVFWDNRQEPFL